jgi:hypothetical protein
MLVPEIMHRLGRSNWWYPAWFDKATPRISDPRARGSTRNEKGSSIDSARCAPFDQGCFPFADHRSKSHRLFPVLEPNLE